MQTLTNVKNNQNEFLITGAYYQHNPGEDTNARYLRPMHIKIDSLGNEQWHLLWGVNEFFYGFAINSLFNQAGHIYSVGQNSSIDPPGYQGAVFKIDNNGNQIFTKNIPDSTASGIATTVSLLEDSILFIGTSYGDGESEYHTTIYKTDTLGNILKERELLQEPNTFTSSIITHDNKYLVTGGFVVDGNWDIYLWKFNRDLEYDSTYTQPRVYDSLCPYGIRSDTIDLDTTTVNLQELYKQMHQIKVYPNPASTKCVIKVGDLVKGNQIILYNSNGQVVERIDVQVFRKEYEIDVSGYLPGLYMVVLLNKDKVVDTEKVIVNYK